MKEFLFREEKEFIEKLKELIQSGVPIEDIRLILPYPIEEIDEILEIPKSKLRFFTLLGAVSGTIAGFVLTIYTALRWHLNTGGKPLISIPPFIIIAFELTILFGALSSLIGFLILSRLPSPPKILSEKDYGSNFIILIDKKKNE